MAKFYSFILAIILGVCPQNICYATATDEGGVITVAYEEDVEQSRFSQGLHQYKMTYSIEDTQTKEKNSSLCPAPYSLTIIGCNHAIPREDLPGKQPDVIEALMRQKASIASEKADFYLDTKLIGYINILASFLEHPHLLFDGYFEKFTRAKFGPHAHVIDPAVTLNFTNLMRQVTSKAFIESIGLQTTEETLKKIATTFSDAQTVSHLPQRLVYDFVLSVLKKGALENQVLDNAKQQSPSLDQKFSELSLNDEDDKSKVERTRSANHFISLDEGDSLSEEEKQLFLVPVDFSQLIDPNIRNTVLNFYGSNLWRFNGEEGVKTYITPLLSQQLSALCGINPEARAVTCQAIALGQAGQARTRLKIDPRDSAARKALSENPEKIAYAHYASGSWKYSGDDRGVAKRNYQWLQGPLQTLVFDTEERNKIALFGYSHLKGVASENHRGILDFFIDLMAQQNYAFWQARLGESVFGRWAKLRINSIERLTQDGRYVDLVQSAPSRTEGRL